MAGITLEIAKAQLQLWIEADTAVASNQSKTIAGRTFTRVNATEITEKIEYWSAKVRSLENGGIIRSSVVNL